MVEDLFNGLHLLDSLFVDGGLLGSLVEHFLSGGHLGGDGGELLQLGILHAGVRSVVVHVLRLACFHVPSVVVLHRTSAVGIFGLNSH